MSLFVVKIVVTPLLIAAATLASRRWGSIVGGWIIGLPLTSGPVSVFLALEQGPAFAVSSALGTLLGTLSVMAFILAYVHAAQKFSWPIAATLALCAFCLGVKLLTLVTLPLLPAAAIVFVLVGAALVFEKKSIAEPIRPPAFRWDIPFRMAVATIMVLLITSLSTSLGPRLSGLLSAFPVFISVMSAFSHKLCGAESVRQLGRGILIGSFSFASFFLAVALAMPRYGIAPAYLLAILAATVVNMGIVAVFLRKKRTA